MARKVRSARAENDSPKTNKPADGKDDKVNIDRDAAIADFDEAIRLDPKLAIAYANRGAAQKAKGDIKAALADLDEAFRLDPSLAQVAYYDSAKQAVGSALTKKR